MPFAKDPNKPAPKRPVFGQWWGKIQNRAKNIFRNHTIEWEWEQVHMEGRHPKYQGVWRGHATYHRRSKYA